MKSRQMFATLIAMGIFGAIGFVAPLVASDTHQDMDMAVPMTGEASVMAGSLELSHAFTRAMPPRAATGGGFVTVTNHGDGADRLIGASSDAAGVVELHSMRMDGDVMIMEHQAEGIEIAAGQTVVLAPGGLHLMFMQITAPFVEGTTVEVMLQFEIAGEVMIALPVAPIGATGAEY